MNNLKTKPRGILRKLSEALCNETALNVFMDRFRIADSVTDETQDIANHIVANVQKRYCMGFYNE